MTKIFVITVKAGADPGFPVGGGANFPGEGRQQTIVPIFPKNYMKLRKVYAVVGGHAPGAPHLDLPLKRAQTCHTAIFCVRDKDAATAPARHM